MLTLEKVLPKLTFRERITSQYATQGNYMRFTLEIKRMFIWKQSFDIELRFDNHTLDIRYYYAEDDTRMLPALESFIQRLEEHVRSLPEFRLRAVTGALKPKITSGFKEESPYVDFHEMMAFFATLLFGLACVFEVLQFFNVTKIGFLVLTGVILLGLLFAMGAVWFEDKGEWKQSEFWLYFVFSLVFVVGITLALCVGLFLALLVSWILPWFLTVSGFAIAFFGYHWAVKFIKKVSDLNQKYSAS